MRRRIYGPQVRTGLPTHALTWVCFFNFLLQPIESQLEKVVSSSVEPRRLLDGSRRFINADLPFVFVTARINLAHKLEADLKKCGIHVHNYMKSKPKGVSMEEWIKHPRIIISMEQVDKLESSVATYQHGLLVIDECVTAASSIVNGATVHQPGRAIRTLGKLTDLSSYLSFDGCRLSTRMARARLYSRASRRTSPCCSCISR